MDSSVSAEAETDTENSSMDAANKRSKRCVPMAMAMAKDSAATSIAGEAEVREQSASSESAEQLLQLQEEVEERNGGEKEPEPQMEVDKSIFERDVATFYDEGLKLYVESTPLPESLKMKYTGTFTVFLDSNDKICRYEFIYTADE